MRVRIAREQFFRIGARQVCQDRVAVIQLRVGGELHGKGVRGGLDFSHSHFQSGVRCIDGFLRAFAVQFRLCRCERFLNGCPLVLGEVVLREAFRCRDRLIQGYAVRLCIRIALFHDLHDGRDVLRIPGDLDGRYVCIGRDIEFRRIFIEFADLDPFAVGLNLNSRFLRFGFRPLEQDGDLIDLLAVDQLILHITRIGSGKGGGNRAVA